MGNKTNAGPESAESVVQIDEHKLDKECVQLASNYLKYAYLAAEAKKDVDELKAELEVTEAELARKIRNTPNTYGIEKVTDKAVEATILLQEAYIEKRLELQDARHEYDLAQAVVSALEHKKRSLTLLVDLHGMGYFAAPKMSEKGKQTVSEMMQRRLSRSRQDED